MNKTLDMNRIHELSIPEPRDFGIRPVVQRFLPWSGVGTQSYCKKLKSVSQYLNKYIYSG